MKTSVNIQDQVLNQARKDKILLTIFLVNGVQIKGFIRGFDNYVLLIEVDGKQNIIYKHAISTIIPSRPISMRTEEEPDKKEE
ncbi:MAG: RNA chaperone Hfq [Peptostreptococcaceae bacterium]|nr:RNA chaperone Hfq [Peptostreptococcaceae bacterium]